MTAIGDNIKRLREKNGYSQADLADKLGKTRAAISQYENGATVPRMGVIEKMALVFQVPKSELIENEIDLSVISVYTEDELEFDSPRLHQT